jgi:uncharacterized damage-inducible protein DinB
MFMSVKELLTYTNEERARWEKWFQANGDELLAMPIAGDRDPTIGRLIVHIFGPELRYVEHLHNEGLTDYRALPASSVETVFGFGLKTRSRLSDFIAGLTADEWARVVDVPLPSGKIRASVRKIVLHILLHELRHWAQIARIMRERGFEPPGQHDLLTSSALE